MKNFVFLFLLILPSAAQALDYQIEVLNDSQQAELVQEPRPNQLPDGKVVKGFGGISEAWLSHPTNRYDHGVLGDAIEAGGVTAVLGDKQKRQLLLPQNYVFEDRLLRPVDLDGQGETEFLVVRSHLDLGAALVAVGLVDGQLKIIAETDPIGLSHRWLNPVGVGDFDGDGEVDVAVVITPHIGGTLAVYGFKEGKFIPKHKQRGFSNHAYGSRELGMSTVGDIDGDGIIELFVPDENRRDIRVVSFRGGRFKEIARIKNPPAFAGRFVFFPARGEIKARLTYPLNSKQRVDISFTP